MPAAHSGITAAPRAVPCDDALRRALCAGTGGTEAPCATVTAKPAGEGATKLSAMADGEWKQLRIHKWYPYVSMSLIIMIPINAIFHGSNDIGTTADGFGHVVNQQHQSHCLVRRVHLHPLHQLAMSL